MKTTTTLVLALVLSLATAAAANAATATHYLLSRQTASGGFAEAGSGRPSAVVTEWTVMGLRAAGIAPARVHRSGGKTVIAYLASRAASWKDAYDLERGILAVVAARRNPSAFAGRNLVAALRGKIGSRGGIGPAANSTYWGVLALRAARSPVPARTLSYIRSRRHRNGGYGWSISAAPDSNDTAAAVLALHAAGVGCGNLAISRGLAYLRSGQPVDLVGDPGPPRLRPAQRPRAPVAAGPPAPERRVQLPAGHDDHTRVRDGAGAPGRARAVVPHTVRRSQRSHRSQRNQTATATTR
jgi:hypothetical protein